jgi:hypothetical protein
MGWGTRAVWHLPHLAMGRAQRASLPARPSSLPPLFAGAAGGAEGDAGWSSPSLRHVAALSSFPCLLLYFNSVGTQKLVLLSV